MRKDEADRSREGDFQAEEVANLMPIHVVSLISHRRSKRLAVVSGVGKVTGCEVRGVGRARSHKITHGMEGMFYCKNKGN